MKRIKLIFVAATGVALLAACQATTPQQQSANCAVGTIGGAALGGILGNQIGGGTGNDIATVAGAAAGGLAGSAASCQ